ncbi:FtsW/RodA/SpoVE family cell cycle protein [Clostridium chauvoei]|uniref:FtsW/RodA/SpoVE family cell cycle protein n=1 Tax=Clostridium chauvoei TaxID=46867 RepID=UPI001C85A028|nr:FtsW/RodA/SpoVE family cell cycle protein [Clostridium chauvoei]MBX7355339.1 FtsW/RodA/SpoVE family cell cycle protein [Clostridium chauvoei]
MKKNNVLLDVYANSLPKTIIFALGGILLLVLMLKIAYRNLKKYCKFIYISTIIISLITIFFSSHINGAIGWVIIGPISFNIFTIAPFFLIISLAGIFENWNWNNKKYLCIGLLLALLPSLIFILEASLSNATIYLIAAITVMFISGVKLKHIIISFSPLVIFLTGFFLSAPYRINRLLGFLNPYNDPEGSGWIYIKLNDLRNSAGLFGNGAIFAAQFLLNILMNFSASPITGVGLPFISYGGSSLLINIFAIAIISNVYKWRNTPFSSIN